MAEITDFEIVDAMIAVGGGFAEALGRCYLRADNQNRARLKAAFPDLWQQYFVTAARLRQNETVE